MTVEVLLFASLRDAIGEKLVRVEVPDDASVLEVAGALFRERNAVHLCELPVRYAVDEAFVPETHVPRDGDRIAIIPPVSGG
jgi:molybdopterin converting factor subunit 1